MTVLSPNLPFMADETLLSWAARLAALHTGGRLIPFLNDLGIAYPAIIGGKLEEILLLCDATGQDPAPVLRNTMFNIDRRSFTLRGEAFAKKFIAMQSTRFCPACLATDSASNSPINAARYSRLSWALRRPIHHVPLMQQRAALKRSPGLRKVDIFGMTYPWLALRSKLTELELVRRVF